MTFAEYQALGYSAVPESEFTRWFARAEAEAKRLILQRPFIHADDEPCMFNEFEPQAWAVRNQRGIAEIMDARFKQSSSATGIDGAPITSFSNQQYSESYASSSDTALATDITIVHIMRAFFTPEQIYRGVG